MADVAPAVNAGVPPDAAAAGDAGAAADPRQGDTGPGGGRCRPNTDGGIGLGPNIGWPGSKACREGARLWNEVPASDRNCLGDDDCVLVESQTCFRVAVTRAAAERYRKTTPCVNPASGPCMWQNRAALCRDGCCEVVVRPGKRLRGRGE